MASRALRHVCQAGVSGAGRIDASSVVGDRDAHAPRLSLPRHIDAHGRRGRVCVAGDIRQAFAHDRDDVVGQVRVDATVEFVDDDELVVQVRVDGATVERDEQRRGEAQGGTRER